MGGGRHGASANADRAGVPTGLSPQAVSSEAAHPLRGAYYNEFDPKAAAWLRELIAAGLIAPGVVDERDIRDVTPDELRPFQQVHLFAGIGGWSAALRSAGWPDDRRVWTASCPCQPFSSAGKRTGFADERHLWPAAYHLATLCGVDVLLGEQSSSKDGLAWLDLVSADMEAAGYTGGSVDLCSAGFGAPNIRQRSYFVWVANADGGNAGAEGLQRSREHGQRTQDGCALRLVHADGERGRGGQSGSEDATDARQPSKTGRMGNPGSPARERNTGAVLGAQAGEHGSRGAVDGRVPLGLSNAGPGMGTRPSPTNGYWRAADWLCCTDERWRPVAPGTFPLVTGLPGRVALLRGAGNAINIEVASGFIEAVIEAVASQEQREAA